MTDVVVDTLRLRGTHGRRLARVAARALPTALDRALADLGDLEVSSVRVCLDLDPEEYDDETLAALWADLVRAELVARGGAWSVRSASSGGGREPGATTSVADTERVVAAARGWLSTPGEARTAVPAPLLRLADHQVAAVLAAAVGPAGWDRLVESLREVLSIPVTARPPVSSREVDRTAGLDDPRREAGPEVAVAPSAPAPAPVWADDGAGAGGPDGRGSAAVDGAADVLAVVGALNELHAGLPTPLDTEMLTRSAGLVLLYPWLADHCDAAEAMHPGLDRYGVREAALAALVGDPPAVDDPLVRMLAGRVPPWEPSHERFELPRQAEVDSSAGRVLASFASLLPGFERSTPEFVRSTWLVRLGALDLERSPALLTAATHPLDVLLPLLPYPLGLLKLPWSPTLAVRFRP